MGISSELKDMECKITKDSESFRSIKTLWIIRNYLKEKRQISDTWFEKLCPLKIGCTLSRCNICNIMSIVMKIFQIKLNSYFNLLIPNNF